MELRILYFPSSNFKKRKQSIWFEGFPVDHRNELYCLGSARLFIFPNAPSLQHNFLGFQFHKV